MTAASDRGTETVRPEADDRELLELIDTLAAGDGQGWPHFWESADQQHIGRMMYGAQARALLASSWLAKREAAVREKVAQEIEHEAARERARGGLDKQREGNVLDRAAALARGASS